MAKTLTTVTSFGTDGVPAKTYDKDGNVTGTETGTWRFPVIIGEESMTFKAGRQNFDDCVAVTVLQDEYQGRKYARLFRAYKSVKDLEEMKEAQAKVKELKF
jgi:hypothetical protein